MNDNDHTRLTQAIEDALAAANAERDPEISERLRSALNAFAQIKATSSAGIAKLLAPRVPDLESPVGMGLLAVWIGAAVENGADPADTLFHLVEAFMRLSRTLPDLDEDEERDLDEVLAGHEETLIGLQNLGRSIVSHLSRGKGLKQLLEAHPGACAEIERASHASIGAGWIQEILRQRSGELVVLHGIESKGFRLAYENIGNCFHLFSLLQGALENRMPGGKKTSPETLAAARGTVVSQKAHDQAWWHYGQGTNPKAELNSLIYGEASPDSIIPIDGTQVILLWPNVMERGWDGGFFSPTLKVAPPDVRVLSELSADEVSRWRERLGLAPAHGPADTKWNWLPWKKKQ